MALPFQSFGSMERVMAFIVGVYVWETYLSFRQWRRTFAPQPDHTKALEPDGGKYARAQAYSRAKLAFSLATGWISTGKELLFFSFLVYPKVWQITSEWSGGSSYWQVFLYLLSFTLFDTLFSIPFSLYA